MTNRRRRVLVVCSVAVMLMAGWLIVRRIRGPVVPVVVIQKQDLVRTIVASGRVIASDDISMGAAQIGTITQVRVDEGDRVRANQPLIELESARARAVVERARAAVAATRAQLREVEDVTADVAAANLSHAESALVQARDTARRSEALVKGGAISVAERDAARRAFEQAETRVRGARAQVASASKAGAGRRRAHALVKESEAALAAAEAQLAQTVIRAPTDGVVLRRDVEPGDVAQPGAALLQMGASGPPQLLIQPDEKHLSDLALGQQARASADAYPRQSFAAVVTEIAPAIDAQRGTIDVVGGVTDIYLRVSDLYQANAVADEAAARTKLTADSWMELNTQLAATIRAQNATNVLVRLFISLAVALGIASVLAISVIQKSREIGILRAMGCSPRRVRRVFLIEGLLLGLVGSLFGVGLGFLWGKLLQQLAVQSNGKPLFYIQVTPEIIVAAVLTALLTGLLSAYAPARRAARLDPAEAIRA